MLPEYLIKNVLEFFQTKKTIKIDNLTEHEINQKISNCRKNLMNAFGIKTDIESILKFSMICKRFNDIINKSDTGKLILSIYYNSLELKINDVLQHISFCPDIGCVNICHYVNKDIKYSNLIKRIKHNKKLLHR